MKQTLQIANVGFLAMALAFTVRLEAQVVVLSEIRADPAERWVEIHNRGATPADLSTWSLYYSTATTSMPQNYWWAFPSGTVVPPDGHVRVFWFQNATAPAAAGEYYTGTSPYGFLFSLGGEALRGDAGAFALIDTQQSALMSTASRFVDWVSWGQHGFMRETLAVQNGVWSIGRHAPAIPPGQSLARNVAVIGTMVTRDAEWFLDATPTPMAPNLAGMAIHSYGQSCTALGHHLVGQPLLRTTSLPILGNAQFGFAVDNTTGFFGETMLLAFSAAAAPVSTASLLPSLPGSSCYESINTGAIVATVLVSTHVMSTTVPLSLANTPAAMAGVELHAQALVFDWLPNAYPPFQGISNALMIAIGQ